MEAKAGIPDASHLYEVEYRAQHAARPGLRIQELRLSKTQKVPWHYHNNVQDTFYVLAGRAAHLSAGSSEAAAPGDQRRRAIGQLPGAAGRGRIRLCPAGDAQMNGDQ